MITTTVTLATGKAGKLVYFTIQFEAKNFDKVIEQVSESTIETIYNNSLWQVI
jgi:hypothetical protein